MKQIFLDQFHPRYLRHPRLIALRQGPLVLTFVANFLPRNIH